MATPPAHRPPFLQAQWLLGYGAGRRWADKLSNPWDRRTRKGQAWERARQQGWEDRVALAKCGWKEKV